MPTSPTNDSSEIKEVIKDVEEGVDVKELVEELKGTESDDPAVSRLCTHSACLCVVSQRGLGEVWKSISVDEWTKAVEDILCPFTERGLLVCFVDIGRARDMRCRTIVGEEGERIVSSCSFVRLREG
jgi:hypothetical protein